LVAAQLSSLRGAEVQKAVNKLDQLAPTIQDFRERGYAVAVTLVVEAPNQIDIAALMAGIGDPGQVGYFKDMYISGVSKPLREPQTHPSISENLAPRTPEQENPQRLTLQQEIAVQMGEKYPIPGSGPRAGFHFLTGTLGLPALTGAAQPSRQPTQQTNLRGIVGSYLPYRVHVFVGPAWLYASLVSRRLQVDLDPQGAPRPRMWQWVASPQLYAYQPYAVPA